MRIRYYASYGRLDGYGRAARDYLAALAKQPGIELEIAVLGDRLTSPEPRYRHLDRFCVPFEEVVGAPSLEIYHAPPRVLADRFCDFDRAAGGPPRLALTTWETSKLPGYAGAALERFDAVIAPSEFCADAIGSPRGQLVHIVPHCFDPLFWRMPPVSPAAPRPFRFYAIGAWGERKNMLGVLRAYLHAFSNEDNVQLLLLISGANFEALGNVLRSSALDPARLPGLHIPDNVNLDEDQLEELHRNGDCYVSAARGEGWGLGMFEAAIMGRYVVSSLYGGQMDFLEDYRWHQEVSFQMTPCFAGSRPLDGREPDVDATQLWAEPNLSDLAAHLREIYETSLQEQRSWSEMMEARVRLEEQFSYDVVGKYFATLLREFT